MLEAGGILIVMGVIFAAGAAGEWILSLFYGRYLRDTRDMQRPGKKLVKLVKLRYETSYYLNGTVHNAKTMVNGMLEHYRLAGLPLRTWHHIAQTAACLCGAIGFASGGLYVIGRYLPAVRAAIPLSGMNAIVYTLAGAACAGMLFFWRNMLDNCERRERLLSNLVDFFDNEKYHQLGREIALSGRVREIAGDRGRKEDPGSLAAEEAAGGEEPEQAQPKEAARRKRKSAQTPAAKRKIKSEEPEADSMVAGEGYGEESMSGTPAGRIRAEESMSGGTAERTYEEEIAAGVPEGGITIRDILEARPADAAASAEDQPSKRTTVRKKTTSQTRARAKRVQIAEEEIAGRQKQNIILPMNPKQRQEPIDEAEDGEAGAAATQLPAGASAAGRKNRSEETGGGRTEQEEELLKLLREYMRSSM